MQKPKSGVKNLKKCEICGEEFDTNLRKCSDVCSPKCAKKKKSIQDAKVRKGQGVIDKEVVCKREGCNAKFKKLSATHLYCSGHCVYLAKIAREKGVTVRKECVHCGSPFTHPKYSPRDTCSEECLTEYKKLIQPNKKKETEVFDPKPWGHAMGTAFYDMETGCTEFRSWDCPEMDPLTTRHVATVTAVWAIWKPKRRWRKAA